MKRKKGKRKKYGEKRNKNEEFISKEEMKVIKSYKKNR